VGCTCSNGLKPILKLDQDQLWQLLAIRMAWEWVLYRYITQQEADEHRAFNSPLASTICGFYLTYHSRQKPTRT